MIVENTDDVHKEDIGMEDMETGGEPVVEQQEDKPVTLEQDRKPATEPQQEPVIDDNSNAMEIGEMDEEASDTVNKEVGLFQEIENIHLSNRNF